MKTNLENKTVIVTGGNSGLGAAICTKYSQEGARLSIFDIDNFPTFSQDENVLYTKGDVTNVEDIERSLSETHQKFGGIDILVNNAGIWPAAKINEMTDEEWDHTLQVNLSGAFYFSKRFIRYLLNEKMPGKIINIVSPAAFQGSVNGHSHYVASKAGLIGLTRSLALEVAGNGIRVVAVAPGIMQTNMTKSRLDSDRNNYLRRIPIGRFIEPAEVANIVVFLSSDLASCITGATIDATGGMLGH